MEQLQLSASEHTNPQEVLVKQINLRVRDKPKMHKDQSPFSKPSDTVEYKCCFRTGKNQYVRSHTGQCCIRELWSLYHFGRQTVDILICIKMIFRLQLWVCARVKGHSGARYRTCGEK